MTLCKYALIVHELALSFPAQGDGTRTEADLASLRAIARECGVTLNDVIAVAIKAGVSV
jgi:hypothetical protein